MKLKLLSLLLCSFAAIKSEAQTNSQPAAGAPSTNSVMPLGALTQGYDWLTSINTNLSTFSGTNADMWTGASYSQGVQFASATGLEYPVKRWMFQSITENASIGGIIASEQLNVGYTLYSHYDLRLSILAGGGDNFALKQPFGDVSAEVEKAFGQYIFSGLQLQERFTGGKLGAPVVIVFGGFTIPFN